MYKFFTDLGLPFEYKIVPWVMGRITNEKPGQIDTFEMRPELGIKNWFDMFAFSTGVEMDDSAKEELMGLVKFAGDLSEEERRKFVNVAAGGWIEQNIKAPMAQATMLGMDGISGAPLKKINFGFLTTVWGSMSTSTPVVWYPKSGTLEDALIAPMIKYFIDHGGEVITNRTVWEIIIEKSKAIGVAVADHNNNFMVEEYDAPTIICAVPIFEAVAKNILRREFLTDDWAEAIGCLADMAGPDLSGFFLLRKKLIPKGNYGWTHLFDSDYGIPTYVGDYALGPLVNVGEPRGKQLVCSLVVGSSAIHDFGLKPSIKTVLAGHRRWKESMEKAFPGFNEAIEYEAINLQLNFTRYSFAAVPCEINVQSPNIKGLYFAGDSIRSLATLVSEKCFELAYPVYEQVRKYVHS